MSKITFAKLTEIQFEASRAYLAAKTPPPGVTVRFDSRDKADVELETDDREWLFGLLEAGELEADDEDLMRAYRERGAKKRSWFASLMAAFGI